MFFPLLVAAVLAEQLIVSSNSVKPNYLCLIRHCALPVLKCQTDAQCRKASECMSSCPEQDQQKCQSYCFFLYANEKFNDMTGCATKHQCLPVQTWSDYSCPAVSSLKNRVDHFDLNVFTNGQQIGNMYVARGAHNCFPCQRLLFEKVGNSVHTQWTTDLGEAVRGANYTLEKDSKNSLQTEYFLFGMPVKEHYYIVDYTENYDFILYFYCGGGFGGEYQGALVYSRLPGQKIPEQVNQRFQLAMERLGVSKYVPKWDDWCVPDYKNCHNLE